MDGSLTPAAPAVFDPTEVRASGLRPRLGEWLMDQGPLVYSGLRTVWPNLRICGLVLATRREDVEEILANTKVFPVRSGTRLAELQTRARIPYPPPPFGLGSDDDDTYGDAMKAVSKAVLLDDVERLATIVREFVALQVAAVGTLDFGTLSLLTSAHLGRVYFGLDVEDSALHELALCCLSLISYAFGNDKINSPGGRVGCGAAARISAVLRRSIDIQKDKPREATVVGRLIRLEMNEQRIESMLTGLLMALVAAPTVALMNIVIVLLRRAEAMKIARAAALAGDDVALGRCLMEALRFKPLSPGSFRLCKTEFVIAGGTRRALRARPGDVVLSVTHSAMFDGRRVAAPNVFNPDRPAADTLVFSFGRHLCLGFAIGRMQVVRTLKPLLQRGLSQTGVDRSAISYFGVFPEHFPVRLG